MLPKVLRALKGLVWKDIKLFGVDRQALVMSVAVPVIIASILGWLDSSASGPKPGQKISLYFVDEDRSALSQDLYRRLDRSDSLKPIFQTRENALKAVQKGDIPAAVLIPTGFERAAKAFFVTTTPATLPIYTDPAKPTEGAIVEGNLQGLASQAAAKAAIGAMGDMGSPVKLDKRAVSSDTPKWSKAAHDYAGFGLQGLLFFAVESAVALNRERRLGLWRRVRSTPVRPGLILLGKGISSFILALGVILLVFGVGAALFHIWPKGTPVGFALMAVCTAMMTSAFALLIATLGGTESRSRAISILLILVMLATGGAWFPMSQMPNWVQTMATYLPGRWAVDGFDAATWRGLGLFQVLQYALNLLGFAWIFGFFAAIRFRSIQNVD